MRPALPLKRTNRIHFLPLTKILQRPRNDFAERQTPNEERQTFLLMFCFVFVHGFLDGRASRLGRERS
jgi:hypothetical protein